MSPRPYSHTIWPPWQGNSPKHLSPGAQPHLWLAEVTTKCMQHVAFGCGLFLFFLPLLVANAEPPSPYHCLSGEKSPTTCPPCFFSSVLCSWLNNKNHALQGKVAAEGRLSGKSFPDMDSQILGNIPPQIPSESNLWAGYIFPSLFISFSSNGSSLGAVQGKRQRWFIPV